MGKMVKSVGRFCDHLTRLIVNPLQTGNALLSPLGILTILSLILLGSEKKSRLQLKKALRWPLEIDDESIDNYIHFVLHSFEKKMNQIHPRYQEILVMRNMALYSSRVTLLPEFEFFARTKYKTKLTQVNFEKDERKIIHELNQWLNRSTDAFIFNFVSSLPPKSIEFIFVNSIYFEAIWATPFHQVKVGTFYNHNGHEQSTLFISSTGSFKFLEVPFGKKYGMVDDHLKMIEIPYYNSDICMIFYLPPKCKSVNCLVAQKSLYDLAVKLISLKSANEISLKIPKFKFGTNFTTKKFLADLGAPDLFTGLANFSGMSFSPFSPILDVVHSSLIKVDEEGTTAASVSGPNLTPEMLSSETQRRENEIEFIVNRPFAFMIFEKRKGLPLFVGKFSDVMLEVTSM